MQKYACFIPNTNPSKQPGKNLMSAQKIQNILKKIRYVREYSGKTLQHPITVISPVFQKINQSNESFMAHIHVSVNLFINLPFSD